MDVLCVGAATIDVFILLQNLQKFSYDKFTNNISFPLGEKIPLDEYRLCVGGNSCNVAVGLARLGFRTSLAAEIGSDEFSEKILNTLRKENVDESNIEKNRRVTPFFNIALSYEGERTILEEKKPDDGYIKIITSGGRLIYLSSVGGDWRKTYEEIFESNPNSLLAFNPGSRQISENLDEVLRILPRIEILFVNLGEAHKLTKDSDPDVKVVMAKLKDLGPKICVVTDGINGSYGADEDNNIFQIVALSKEKPKERTGAGDSYAAGFIYGILSGRSVEESMRYGAINSASVIQKIGAQEGLLYREEIELRAKENLGLTAVKI